MSLFFRVRSKSSAATHRPTGEPATASDASTERGAQPIPGDRGVPPVNRARSVQSRVSRLLAIALMSALGLSALAWYYARTLPGPSRAQQVAEATSRSRAQGETSLQSIGHVRSPLERQAEAGAAPGASPGASVSPAEGAAGSAPHLAADATATGFPSGVPPAGVPAAAPPKSPGQLALERRLSGPAFARTSNEAPTASQPSVRAPLDTATFAAVHAPGASTEGSDHSAQGLGALLRPTVTPAVSASVLPTRRFLLAKGAFIDCTLETAIDSTLPGMTTCVTATDTFSADGSVVLLERGTKLIGETRGQLQQGTARIFVLWTEGRTPTGVVVPLSSPGTDELGRSGLSGEVHRHFWDRFGAALLLSVVSGAVQGAVNSQNSSGSVVVSPSTSTDVMTEVLKSTVNIPPTVTKAQGDRIQVLVARDVDFRSVYTLRAAKATPAPETQP